MSIIIQDTLQINYLLEKYNEKWHKEVFQYADKIVFYGKVDVNNNNLTYIIFEDCKYYTAQCLDIDVATFGNTIEDAKVMMKEALTAHLG